MFIAKAIPLPGAKTADLVFIKIMNFFINIYCCLALMVTAFVAMCLIDLPDLPVWIFVWMLVGLTTATFATTRYFIKRDNMIVVSRPAFRVWVKALRQRGFTGTTKDAMRVLTGGDATRRLRDLTERDFHKSNTAQLENLAQVVNMSSRR